MHFRSFIVDFTFLSGVNVIISIVIIMFNQILNLIIGATVKMGKYDT